MSLSLKFEEYPISGCWDIQIFILWGHLPLEVIFHWRSSSLKPFLTLVWSHELMFKILERSILLLLRYSNFRFLTSSSIRGHLPLEAIFHWRSSSLKPYLTLVWSHELMFKIWGRSDQCLLRYSNFHILRSSSIRGRLPLKVVFIQTFFDFGLVPWAYV